MNSQKRRTLCRAAACTLLILIATISAFAQNSTDISSSPTSLEFPTTFVGLQSGAKVLTITNLTGGGLTITSISFSCAGFGISSGTAPFSFGATQSITHYSIYFQPSTATTYNCDFNIYLNDGTYLAVPISGTGQTSTATASVANTSLSFPNQTVGTTSAPQTITITNTGTTGLTLSDITLSPPSFTTNSIALPYLLHAGTSLPISVYYTPSEVTASESGAIDFTYNSIPDDGGSLSGNGVAAKSLIISTNPTLPQATQSAAYQATFATSGGTGPYSWALESGSSLPSGLTLSSAGVISGTLASSVAAGNYTFSVQVTDNTTHATASGTFTVGVFANLADNCNDISFDVVGTSNPEVALTDLGTGTYQGYEGGLYPNGSNVRPSSQDSYGVTLAEGIVPLDSNGNSDPNGSYVLMAIGESTAQNEFNRFLPIAYADPAKNPHLVIVNGAQGGATPFEFENTTSPYWATVMNNYLPQNGVTPAQVVAIWMEDTDGINTGTFPSDVAELQTEYENMMQTMHTLFPNLKMVYFSSRVYGGYSNGVGNPDNPEPYSYEVGFAVKWAIQDQINGDANLNDNPANGPVVAPWMSWGPYYWANGMLGRKDGLEWDCADFSSDGTHPSSEYGQLKVATELLQFLKTDDTTMPWYLASSSTLTVNGGNNQTGTVGTALPTALSVLAATSGTAQAGVSVTFNDNGAGGTFNPTTATTNSSGIASSTYTPKTAGTISITATATGYAPASFTETISGSGGQVLTVNGGNNQTGTEGTTLPTQLSVVATNNGVPVAGVSVTFNAGGGTFNPKTATTNSSGIASTSYTLPTSAGTITVTATATGYSSATFTETSTTSSGGEVLTVNGGNNQTGTKGTALPTQLSVIATNNGSPVSGVAVTFSAKGGSFNPKNATTNASGIASTTYTLPSSAGTITVTASATGYTSANFTETSTNGSTEVLTATAGNNQTGTVSTTLPVALTVTATNNGSPVSGVSVTFTSSGGGSFGTPTVTTNSSGVGSTTYTLPATAGTVTITAAASGYTSATFTETATAGGGKILAVNGGNNQSGVEGTTLPTALTVLATNNGSPVSGVAVTFTAGGGTFNPVTATTNSAGVASTTYTLPKNVGTIKVTASATGYTSTTFSETSTKGSGGEVLAATAGNNQTGNVSTTLPVALTVTATNNGSPVSGVSVTFSTSGGGSFGTPTVTTNSSGVASTTYTLPSTAGTVTITAAATGYTSASFTETATNPNPKVITVESGNNQQGNVGTTLPVALGVVATNNGNPVSGLSVTFTSSGGGSFGTPTVTTSKAGLASTTFTLPSTGGVVTVTASATGYASAIFTETANASQVLTATAGNNQSGTAGTTLPVALTVTATNNGSPVSGVSVTFSSAGGGSFGTPTVTTNSSGVASTTYTLPSTAGTITITANATGYTPATFTETATAANQILTVNGGNNQSGTQGTTLPTQLSVVATNNGSPASGVAVTFSAGGGTFSPNPATTNSSGIASTSFTLPNSAGKITVTASATGYTSTTFTETSTKPAAQLLTATAGNNQSGTVGTTLPAALTVTATSNGSPVSGVSVTFSTSGGGSFGTPTVTTNSSGVASTTYTLPSTAGAVTITASATGYTSATFTETATAQPILTATAGNNQSGAAGSTLPVALAVTATNNGNPVSGVSVTFSTSGGGSFGTPTVTTNSSGIASTTYTLPSTAGAVTITASASGYTSATFTETATGANQVLIVNAGNNQTGNVGTTLPVSLAIEATNNGNPVSGVSVTFSSSGGGSFGTPTVTTSSNGIGFTTYTLPSTAGTVTITASATGYTSAVFTETATQGTVTQLGLTSGGQQTGTVGTTLPNPIVVQARNASNQIVAGAQVTFSSPQGGTFSPNPATTDSNGNASVTYTLPTTAESIQITATSGTASINLGAKSVAGPPVTMTIVSGNNQSANPGTQLNGFLIISLTDQYSNGVSGATISFTDNGAGGSFGTPNPVTNANGEAETSYTTGTNPGPVTITASDSSTVLVNFSETVN